MQANRFRPGTDKQAVWEKFVSDGAQAAFDHGVALLMPTKGLLTTVQQWDREYRDGQSVIAAPARHVRKPKGVKATKARAKAVDMSGKQQNEKVYVEKIKPPKAAVNEDGLTAKQEASRQFIKQTKKRIKVSYTDRVAYLVTQGPQASIVMWEHNGAEDCISNKFLGLPSTHRDGTTL
jgi:hypothetical protein